MYSIHGTRKLLDRVKRPVVDPIAEPSTMLGNWYANVLFWKPQIAVLANERTPLPVFMPLAPASVLAVRFPEQLGMVLDVMGVPADFVAQEVLAMEQVSFAKTANRSVVGSMNDFIHLAGFHKEAGEAEDLVALSASLAETPCSPLFQRHTSPDREVRALVAEWSVQ